MARNLGNWGFISTEEPLGLAGEGFPESCLRRLSCDRARFMDPVGFRNGDDFISESVESDASGWSDLLVDRDLRKGDRDFDLDLLPRG